VYSVFAATDNIGGISWEGISTIFTILVAFLTLFWRISTWKATQDERLKSLEAVVIGDGKGNEGCALRHRALESKITEVPTRRAMADAFDQIRGLQESAAEDRRRTDVALERIEGVLRALVDKVDVMMESEGRRPLGRTKTNPGFDPSKR
jgi:hypothetical protein